MKVSLGGNIIAIDFFVFFSFAVKAPSCAASITFVGQLAIKSSAISHNSLSSSFGNFNSSIPSISDALKTLKYPGKGVFSTNLATSLNLGCFLFNI